MDIRFTSLALAALLTACTVGSAPDATEKKDAPLVIGGDDASALTASLYQMPTPNELFHLVGEMAGEGQKRMMSPVLNADRYVTLPSRALNFGVYATDMVYASSFKLTSEVVRYYLTCKKLGGDLGLSSAFNEDDFSRLEKNLTRGDSLDVIGNEVYYKVYQRMQAEDMGATLALVLAGGWVESMHLVTRQVVNFDPADPLVTRVAEQKASLEHLIDMLGAYKSDPNVQPTLTALEELRNTFDELNVRRTAHTGASSSGRMVLGDDVTVSITVDKFNAITKQVEALRDTMTRAEDKPAQTPKA